MPTMSSVSSPLWGLRSQLNRYMGPEQGQGYTPPGRPPGLKNKEMELDKKIRQIYVESNGDNREFLAMGAKEMDKATTLLVVKLKTKLLSAMDNMDGKLHSLERNIRKVISTNDARNQEMIREARRIADSEREEKAILCQWLNGFLVNATAQPHLTSMDFTFARFALNMAMAASRTPPQVMLDAGVASFLVSMLSSPNELVTGPAVIALSQMAQHKECQHALGLAGGVPPLLMLCFRNQSPAVVMQACTSLALLSQHPPNKPIIASKGGVVALVRLIDGFGVEDRVTVEVLGQALTGLVNVMHKSDVNRNLAEECGIIPPTLRVLEEVDNNNALIQACRVVANTTYGNQFTASKLLEAEGDKMICSLIEDTDKTKHSDVMEAGFIALANLANSRMNQAHVGSSTAIELGITVCRVVRCAAQMLCSLSIKCEANKTRCGAEGAVAVLLDLGMSWGVSREDRGGEDERLTNNETDEEEMQGAAAERALSAVAILMQHATNVLDMADLGGLQKLVCLMNATEHNKVLTAAAMAVVVLIPEPDAIVRIVQNCRPLEIEDVGAYDALVRCKEWVFGHRPPPSWLVYGLDVLQCSTDELDAKIKSNGILHMPRELFPCGAFHEEASTPVPPDISITSDEDLRGMLFHIF